MESWALGLGVVSVTSRLTGFPVLLSSSAVYRPSRLLDTVTPEKSVETSSDSGTLTVKVPTSNHSSYIYSLKSLANC